MFILNCVENETFRNGVQIIIKMRSDCFVNYRKLTCASSLGVTYALHNPLELKKKHEFYNCHGKQQKQNKNC